MLEGFRSRAGVARPRQRLLRRGPRRAARDRLPRRRRADAARRLGPRPRRAGRQPAPPGPLRAGDGAGDDRCTATGSASPPSSTGPATRRCAGSSRRAVAGEVFAAGHAEAGNDIPVLLSTCQAERVEGGYRLTGRKQFGSNGPAWRWLGAHAIDVDGAGRPADRARLRRARQPRRDRRRDLGHAGHAPDPEPRHHPRRRVRPRRPHRAGRPRRRRQRPVPRRHGDVAAVADRRGVPRHRRPGPRGGRRRRPAQDVGGHPARRLRLQPVRAAPGRRHVPRARRRRRRPTSASSPTGWPAPTTARRGCRRCTP